jgi:hypothetical protein
LDWGYKGWKSLKGFFKGQSPLSSKLSLKNKNKKGVKGAAPPCIEGCGDAKSPQGFLRGENPLSNKKR